MIKEHDIVSVIGTVIYVYADRKAVEVEFKKINPQITVIFPIDSVTRVDKCVMDD